jgi:hypothetical protein
LIGHVGLYQDGGASQPEKKLHLETFSGDDVEAFIDASRVGRSPAGKRPNLAETRQGNTRSAA